MLKGRPRPDPAVFEGIEMTFQSAFTGDQRPESCPDISFVILTATFSSHV